MSGHTPGPWEFDGMCQIVEAERPHMRVCFLPSDHADYASSTANGRLIAAAPDLLTIVAESRCSLPATGAPENSTVEECVRRRECGCDLGRAFSKATGVSP